jgi:ABC-type glycerol-3-phosphate transport system substrate-binding protein
MYRSIGEEMTVYPFPVLSGDNNSSFSYAEEAVAVNSQSKNKEAAFNFIKIIMSEECQKLEEKGFSPELRFRLIRKHMK